MQGLHFFKRTSRSKNRDTASPRAQLAQRRQHGAVVETMAARLDEHRALQAELAFHALVRLERRLGHVVGALGGQRVTVERAE